MVWILAAEGAKMKKSEAIGGLIPFPRSARAPVVFMLQPKGFRPNTTPEDLKLWEQWMIERVGFSADSPVVAAIRSKNPGVGAAPVEYSKYPNGGISGSNGGWDD